MERNVKLDAAKDLRRGEMVMDEKNVKVGSIVEVFDLSEPVFGNSKGVTVRWNGVDEIKDIMGWELIWNDTKCYWLLT